MNEIVTYDETEKVAKAMVASGFFKDTTAASQAIVKILAGRELGFGAFASMTGVNIIQGKPTIGANLLASAIKATRKYNYRILEMTDKACEIEFYEDSKPVGKSRFDMTDAEKAGLTGKDNWRKYPRNMLFARAISNGQKWYCPDACNGVTVYTPDEMGASVDEDGTVIDMPVVKASFTEPIPTEHDAEPPIKAEVPKPPTNGKASAIYDAVIAAQLAEDVFHAKGALNKCRTGYDTSEKAIAWMRLYRGWRDTGLASDEAANRANSGESPK